MGRHPLGGVVLLGFLCACLWGCSVRDETGRSPRPAAGIGRLLQPRRGPGAPRSLAQPVAQGPARIELVEGYDAGVRRARTEERGLVLVFKATWCRHSATLLNRTLLDPALVDSTRTSVCAVIDADREPEVCRRFAVSVFPTVIVIDGSGATRRLVGRPTAGDLATLLGPATEAPGKRVASGTTPPAR